MTRLFFLVLLVCSTFACDEHGRGGRLPDGNMEEGLTPAPRGGGFCCPIDFQTCDCFRNGGWVAHSTDMCPSVCDLAPSRTRIEEDDHGCDTLTGPDSCLDPGPIDAGLD